MSRYRNPLLDACDHKRSWWTTMLLLLATPAMMVLAFFIPEVVRCGTTTTSTARIRRLIAAAETSPTSSAAALATIEKYFQILSAGGAARLPSIGKYIYSDAAPTTTSIEKTRSLAQCVTSNFQNWWDDPRGMREVISVILR